MEVMSFTIKNIQGHLIRGKIQNLAGVEHNFFNRSSSGDRRVPLSRQSSTLWIWQHDKRTADNKKILNCVRKLMKNK
jgi:hypothetical protein